MISKTEFYSMNKRFSRTIEDFECLHCKTAVEGNGYTNHCPQCLWSRHVDENPGDRANECKGMMEPVRIVLEHGSPIIHHRCQRCGKEKRNKRADNDSMDAIVAVMSGKKSQ